MSYGELDGYFGYVLRRAQLAGFEAFHRATARADITPARFTALVIVGANPGLTQSTLAAALGTARSGAMMVADWMEARGLAERRHRPDDGRTWGLYLTRRGETRLRALKKRTGESDAAFAARLTKSEQAELRRLLEKIAA